MAQLQAEAEQHKAALEAAQNERMALLESVRKLAGVGTDSEEATPEQLIARAQEERDKAFAQLREATLANALSEATSTVGVDTKLAANILRGMGSLDEVDTTTPTFREDVKGLVAKLVEDYPHLVPQSKPQTSGLAPVQPKAENTGLLSRADIDRLASEGKWAEINKAVESGRVQL